MPRLHFSPRTHGFHFPNSFRSRGPVNTDGLCGGMCLAAFNYFRYNLPIPHYTTRDIEPHFTVMYDLALSTAPTTLPLIDYIFHSQIATFANVSLASFLGQADPSYRDEFEKARRRIDRGEYLILGLKYRGADGGHQVLCYGYEPTGQRLFVYDPNYPDQESVITSAREATGNVIVVTPERSAPDMRYRAIFEQQELFRHVTSDRTTYNVVDNVLRNLNFSVRPPVVAVPVPSALAFVQRADATNTTANSSYINNQQVNSNPNAIILVTPGYARATQHVGVWYDQSRGRWAVFNQDRAVMNPGRTFHVTVVQDGFVHTATSANIASNWSYIDHPDANSNLGALVFFTQRWNAAGANSGYNNRAMGVWYDQSRQRWAIYNEDQTAMGQGLQFNVKVVRNAGDNNRVWNRSTHLNIPREWADSNDIVMLTHNYNPNQATGTYFNAYWEIGNEPDAGTWGLYSDRSSEGVCFNVMTTRVA